MSNEGFLFAMIKSGGGGGLKLPGNYYNYRIMRWNFCYLFLIEINRSTVIPIGSGEFI